MINKISPAIFSHFCILSDFYVYFALCIVNHRSVGSALKEAAMEDVGQRHLDGDAVPHEHRKNNAI